jgi:hypothetical protein
MTSIKTSNTYEKVHELKMSCYEKLDELYNNKQTNVYEHYNRYLDMERHMKRVDEYYKIHEEYPPLNHDMIHGKKRRRLVKKYFVELTKLQLLQDELKKKEDKLNKKIDKIGSSFIHKNIKLQKITNKNKKQLERESCSICFDNHKINKMITTCCGHHFGTYCFAHYIDVNYENKNEVVCPLCRNDNLEYFTKYY